MNEIDIARTVSTHAHTPWGWEIPVYLFLGGMAAGVMIASSLLALRAEQPSRVARLLAFFAPVLVSVGMLALFIDLANRENVLRFYAAFRVTSPMSWGAWILVLMYPVSLLFGIALLSGHDAEQVARWAEKVKLRGLFAWARTFSLERLAKLAYLNLAIGIGLGLYTGILLSTLAARPLWNSALLGPLFLVSGLSTGMAFLLLFRVSDGERHVLASWDKWAIVIELSLLAFFLIGLFTSGAAGSEAAGLLAGGRFTAQFWALVVFAGLLVPLALDLVSERTRRPLPVIAPALVLVGGLSLRWILVAAGQA